MDLGAGAIENSSGSGRREINEIREVAEGVGYERSRTKG